MLKYNIWCLFHRKSLLGILCLFFITVKNLNILFTYQATGATAGTGCWAAGGNPSNQEGKFPKWRNSRNLSLRTSPWKANSPFWPLRTQEKVPFPVATRRRSSATLPLPRCKNSPEEKKVPRSKQMYIFSLFFLDFPIDKEFHHFFGDFLYKKGFSPEICHLFFFSPLYKASRIVFRVFPVLRFFPAFFLM